MESKIHHDKIEILSRLIKDNHITKEQALLLLTDEGNNAAKEVIDPQPDIDYNRLINEHLRKNPILQNPLIGGSSGTGTWVTSPYPQHTLLMQTPSTPWTNTKVTSTGGYGVTTTNLILNTNNASI